MKTFKNSIFKFMVAAIFMATVSFSASAQIPKSGIYWQFKSGEIHTYPLVIDTIAYVGSMDKNFYAISTKSGKEIWKFQADRAITTHASVYNGVICFNALNILYGLDVKTGAKKWSFVDRNDAPRTPGASDMHFSSPYIYKGVAYYGDEWGNMNGIDVETGNRVFKYAVPSSSKNIRCMPVIKDDIIYFGDGGRTLYAISVKDSSVKWIHELVAPAESPKWDGTVVSDMVIRDTLLFFGRYTNAMTPVSINTGKVAWIYIDENTFLPNTPVFYKDKVIMGATISSSKIHCINISDGKSAWDVQSMGIHFTTPVIYRDSILIINSTDPFGSSTSQGSGVGIMNFINCKNGKILSDLHLDNSTESSPVIIRDTLLIGKNDGLYALDLQLFMKRNDTSYLEMDKSTETIKMTNAERLGKNFSIQNNSIYCDTITVSATVEGNDSKSNMIFSLKKDYNIMPGEKINVGVAAGSYRLEWGKYKVTFTVASVKKHGTSLTNKIVNFEVTYVNNIKNINSSLKQNPYPNPFENEMNFPISFKGNKPIKLSIYSVEGKLIFSSIHSSEVNLIKWNGNDNSGNLVKKGTYYYSLTSGNDMIKGVIMK